MSHTTDPWRIVFLHAQPCVCSVLNCMVSHSIMVKSHDSPLASCTICRLCNLEFALCLRISISTAGIRRRRQSRPFIRHAQSDQQSSSSPPASTARALFREKEGRDELIGNSTSSGNPRTRQVRGIGFRSGAGHLGDEDASMSLFRLLQVAPTRSGQARVC